jgi:hypothetical protein
VEWEISAMGSPSALAGFLLLLGVASSPTGAHTPGLINGSYERLSAGNQRIARALFDAQAAVAVPAPAGAMKALSLDEIAAQKQTGTTWGQVFSAMKSRGLVRAKDLGQIVNRQENHPTALVSIPNSKIAER